jgi:Domain of unknown function (DUF4394)/PEP-CTERM motif
MTSLRTVLCAIALGSVPLSAAQAEQIAGLTLNQRIVTFNSSAPMTTVSNFAITGLTAGDMLIGIDLRPANSMIYGVAQTGRIYTLTTAGVASLVSTLSVPLSGMRFGIDFNPVPDRLRIISTSDANLRANVATGVTATDTAITRVGGGAIDLVGTAYTNSVPGGPAPATTTIYGIDSVTDSLMTSAVPNGGVYSTVGALGVGLTNTNNVGFDISGRTGLAYVNIDSAFYRLNLGTGSATFVDTIGAGPLIGIAATGAVPEPSTWMMMLAGFGIIGAAVRRRRPSVSFV